MNGDDEKRWERYGKITRKIENVNMLELFTFLFASQRLWRQPGRKSCNDREWSSSP